MKNYMYDNLAYLKNLKPKYSCFLIIVILIIIVIALTIIGYIDFVKYNTDELTITNTKENIYIK